MGCGASASADVPATPAKPKTEAAPDEVDEIEAVSPGGSNVSDAILVTSDSLLQCCIRASAVPQPCADPPNCYLLRCRTLMFHYPRPSP